MRFVAFDVETPNHFNNRMSAIGIAVIEDGEIVYSFHSLVNPEADFDYCSAFDRVGSGNVLCYQVHYAQRRNTVYERESLGLFV